MALLLGESELKQMTDILKAHWYCQCSAIGDRSTFHKNKWMTFFMEMKAADAVMNESNFSGCVQ